MDDVTVSANAPGGAGTTGHAGHAGHAGVAGHAGQAGHAGVEGRSASAGRLLPAGAGGGDATPVHGEGSPQGVSPTAAPGMTGTAPGDGAPAPAGEAADTAAAERRDGGDEGGAVPGGFSPDDYAFDLPEGVVSDPQLTGRFRQFCAASGLTPGQAQAAVGFWLSEHETGAGQALERCEAALRDRWGAGYGERLEAARGALRALDGRMEGRLTSLTRSGLGNAPEFVELMAHLADALGEDTHGRALTAGDAVAAPLSTEDFLKTVVFKR